jgi:putative transposase
MYIASEKLAIIRLVEDSELSIRRTLVEINVSRSSFYRWYQAYERDGPEGLHNHSRASRQHWNKIPESVRELVVDVALDQPELTPDLVTSPQFVVMSAADAFQNPTRYVHELWQTDFTYCAPSLGRRLDDAARA